MYQQLAEHNRLTNKYISIFFVVLFYWTVSILTVFINKKLLSDASSMPLFVTWFQCVVSTIICLLLDRLAQKWPSLITFPELKNPINSDTIRKILPLSVLFTLMVGTNNLCLKYVGVSFYYIGRSLTTVFNVIFTYLILRQKTSIASIVCCIVIVVGFLMGVDQESLTEAFSLLGTTFGILGSMFLALYSIYTKKTLAHVNQEIWLLSYYNNFYSIWLFIPLIILNGEVRALIAYEHLFDLSFVLAMIVGGVFGLLIGFVTALQIKVTSPLTHNISGTAKACVQTVMATQIFQETKSMLWWTSNVVVLVASAAYTRVKQLEMQKNHDNLVQKA